MKSFKEWFLDLIKVVVGSILIALIVVNFLFISVVVDGKSMHSTLKNKDFGVSFILTKNMFGVKRFDIVTVKVDGFDHLLVKRVIGLPHDVIEYKENKLYINGVVVEEPFLNKEQFTENFNYHLDEDEYFVMGDNRVASLDSRSFGPVSKKQIKTAGILILYPFSHFGFKK